MQDGDSKAALRRNVITVAVRTRAAVFPRAALP